MIQAIKSMSTQHIYQPNSYRSWKKGAAAKQVGGLLLPGKKWKCYTEKFIVVSFLSVKEGGGGLE